VNHDVVNVLIMVDDEGDGCSHRPEERRQFIINHTKWVDAAAYLGCHAIRTNCRGTEAAKHAGRRQTIEWAADSYISLIEYAASANIRILIENHGGLSNDADWMTDLMLEINHPFFGAYPDWREPSHEFDNHRYLEKMLPFAKGMSYRNQPTDALSAEMISLCERAGYGGWYGIESSGREAIAKGIRILRKQLA
jgi:sugar phosphate isomerase/epimerase